MGLLTLMTVSVHEEPVITPAVLPAVKLEPGLKEELLTRIEEEGIVIVHCSYTTRFVSSIRIWNSAVLIDQVSGSRSRLLHALNISIAPEWTEVAGGSTARFTLIFAALPKACESFDLFEDIPFPDRFEVKGIQRNEQDVYQVIIQ